MSEIIDAGLFDLDDFTGFPPAIVVGWFGKYGWRLSETEEGGEDVIILVNDSIGLEAYVYVENEEVFGIDVVGGEDEDVVVVLFV